jgi:CRP-like cAMP-binding protein
MAISREDLANMVGTATESLIRTLSDFREEGLVEINGSTITLLNTEKLKRMRN